MHMIQDQASDIGYPVLCIRHQALLDFINSLKMMSFWTSWVPSPREEAQASIGYLWIGCSKITEAAPNRSAAHVPTALASSTERYLAIEAPSLKSSPLSF